MPRRPRNDIARWPRPTQSRRGCDLHRRVGSPPFGEAVRESPGRATAWRARAIGVYRLWRDAGFAVGALTAGIVTDLVSIEAAIYAVAALTAASGVVVIVRMYETHQPVAVKR